MDRTEYIHSRIENKKSGHLRYEFTKTENNALKTFFDLTQEFESMQDFYKLCVAIPKSFFGPEASIYIADPKLSALALVAKTEGVQAAISSIAPEHLYPEEYPYRTDNNSLVLTIRGKKSLRFHVSN